MKYRLAAGVESCFTAGQNVGSEPGAKTGDVAKGLNVRFDDYQGTNFNPADFPPDTNVFSPNGNGTYTYTDYRNGLNALAPAHTGVPKRRILILPIIKKSSISNGNTPTVAIERFGAFFLQRSVPNGNTEITAEYIGDPVVFGDGGYDPTGGAGFAGLTKAVLYR